MTVAISRLDHIAITVADLDRALAFYVRLGGQVMRHHEVDGRRMVAQVIIGGAMLNIHQSGFSNPLVAGKPTPGSADFCFRWSEPIATAVRWLEDAGIAVIDGPVERHASDGKTGMSVYFRDPDGNLLEFLTTV